MKSQVAKLSVFLSAIFVFTVALSLMAQLLKDVENIRLLPLADGLPEE